MRETTGQHSLLTYITQIFYCILIKANVVVAMNTLLKLFVPFLLLSSGESW